MQHAFPALAGGEVVPSGDGILCGPGPSPNLSRGARPWRRVEHYWLCDACSPFVTLTFDRNRGVVTVPLPDGSAKKIVRVVSEESNLETASLSEECEQRTLQKVRK